ncbi:SA1320 family protein, partial [Gemella morbillorum]|uniref:SA1320 family protein n=1 Tax=Gemella morbillorum TaxID=29391 RepID=UPI0023F00AEB
LVNYRNYRDVIGNIGGNPLGIARYVNMGLADDDVFIPSNPVEFYKYLANIPTQYHALATWKFDKDGNLINIKGDIVNPETSVKSIDIDGDGINDIPLKAGDLRLTNLLSERGDISISGEKIQLNPEVLRILSSNIRIKVINDLATIKRITKLCIEKNNKVRMDFNQRKEQVTESIKEELNNTEMPFILDNLRESVGEIIKNKHFLEVLQQKYQLKMEQFSSNEIPLVSGIRLYPYNYNIQLDTLRRVTAPLLNQSQKEETKDTSNLFRKKPTILKSWQEIENNTKRLLEESDKTFEGDGLRTGKEDGISQSLKQVLEVAEKNIEELEKQLQNTAELTQGLAENFEEQDRWIGTKLKQGIFVGSNPVKNMPQSYKAYLERDEIFDDVKDVIQAFDKQVEKRSKEYAKKMAEITGENLDTLAEGLEAWVDNVGGVERKIKEIEKNYDLTVEVEERYKEDDELKVKIRYWGKLKELYPKELVENMAATQDKIISKKGRIAQTIQVTKITKNNLGYLEPNLKKIVEEGVYKAFDLDEIVNSQKIVKSIIEKSQSEIKYVKEHIGTEGMSGEAIKALNQKLEEVNRSLEYYKMFIGDCFGDQE